MPLARMSHPVRVRGLKYRSTDRGGARKGVAPRAGAWIEIGTDYAASNHNHVAPRAGAWIEISKTTPITE